MSHATGRIRRLSDLTGRALQARDGEVGRLQEVHFDDARWTVRYLVVRTGGWLRGRDVLIPPQAVTGIDDAHGTIEVDLTREQVEGSPLPGRGPVSRRDEERVHWHYDLVPWWTATPTAVDARLRSSDELTGFHIRATDGSVGYVADVLISDDDFRVRYLEVDTGRLLPGRHVLVAPAWIEGVSWADREVHVTVDCEAVRSAPPYDPKAGIGPDDEIELFEHYGLAARDADGDGDAPSR